MRIYPPFFKIFFSWMDPEQAHHIGFFVMKIWEKTGISAILYALNKPEEDLQTTVFDLNFPSPFGLAAGFDKNGTGIEALADLGFGHIEVGTITAQGQPGNPKPRLFRLEKDKALINRMGFNNEGAQAAANHIGEAKKRLEKKRGSRRPIIGINIGKTKVVDVDHAIADYVVSAKALAPVADYLVVNVSSPNTAGLRSLQETSVLEPLLQEVRKAATVSGRRVPLLVKISPDLGNTDIDDIARLTLRLKLDGIVAVNTTSVRGDLKTPAADVEAMGVGGLSGEPLKERGLEVLRRLDSLINNQAAIISVGGITNAQDVTERLEAGADLVQGYTAFLYQGPLWARHINQGLKHHRIGRGVK